MQQVEPLSTYGFSAASARPSRAGADGCANSGHAPTILDDFFPANIGWQCQQGLGDTVSGRVASATRNRQEFNIGRQAAYAALCSVGFYDKQIGASDSPVNLTESFLTSVVGRNADRSPRWPAGYVGSISHSRHWIVAAAAQACDFVSIGIDSEPIATPEQAALLQRDIGHATEWQQLERIGLSLPVAFTLLFSAKEAFYKCWYPLKQRFLDFPDVIARRVQPEQKVSSDRIQTGMIALELAEADAMQLMVRYCITTQDIFTLATVINGDVE